MTYKNILATALAASLSLSLANAKIVFDFENLADGSPVSSSTGVSTGWTSGGNTWSSSASGDDSLFAHLTASGYHNGGVISNSKTNTGKTAGADLDTIKGGAASGNNYGVLYLTGNNSSDASKNTYTTASGKIAYKSQFGYNEYVAGGSKFVSEIMSSSVVFDSAVQVGSIDVSMTMFTYFELDNPDNHNNFMGIFSEDEDGNKTYNSLNNNKDSFFGVRIFALDENYEIADESNFVEQILAYNDNGSVYFELDWKTIDISKLNAGTGAFGLAFQIVSSFGSGYGISATSYLAIDNIASIPEPATFAAAFGAMALAVAAYRRRK